jgi:hypothetical protein
MIGISVPNAMGHLSLLGRYPETMENGVFPFSKECFLFQESVSPFPILHSCDFNTANVTIKGGEWCFSILQGVFFTPILQGNSFTVSITLHPRQQISGEWCFSILQGVFFTPILQGNRSIVSNLQFCQVPRISTFNLSLMRK